MRLSVVAVALLAACASEGRPPNSAAWMMSPSNGGRPVWVSTPGGDLRSAVAMKSVSTTRVLVLVADGKLTSSLKAAGFDVQDGQPLLDKFGAQRISRMSDAQLRDAARRVADVVVIGGATGLRAIEVGSGAVVFNALGEALGPNLGAALKAAEQ